GMIVMMMLMIVVVVMMVMIMMGVIMVVIMGMIMIVVRMIMVVMIMIMVMVALILIMHQRLELLACHLLFRDIGLGHDVIDDLLVEDRAAQLEQRIGIFAVIVEHLALLAGELAGALEQSALQFVIGDGDTFLLAHGSQDQPQAHAALGDSAIFLARLFLRR